MTISIAQFWLGNKTSRQYLWCVRCGGISDGGRDITISFTQYWPGSRTTRRYLRVSLVYWSCWCYDRISGGGGGGIWRYPSPGTNQGVGPPASIFNVCDVWKYPAGGGILRYPSPGVDRGVGSPAGIFVCVWCILLCRRYCGWLYYIGVYGNGKRYWPPGHRCII